MPNLDFTLSDVTGEIMSIGAAMDISYIGLFAHNKNGIAVQKGIFSKKLLIISAD
jgi:hypothetical protein